MGGEQYVAGDDRLLGDGGPAAETEFRGDDALVHLGALGEAGFLGVLRDDAVEGLHVLQRTAHDHRVVDALAVVGEDFHSGGRIVHGAELGELLALQADSDGADRLHVAVAGLLAEPPDLLDDTGGVGDREGVGHGMHGGEATDGRRLRPGEDGLGVLAAGLAQVGVEVDQAGQQDLALGLDDGRVTGLDAGTDCGDGFAVDQDVLGFAAEDLRAADKDLAHGYLFSSVRAEVAGDG